MGTTKMPTPVKRPTSQYYWIRKKVPEKLRHLVGKSEVWKSLETADKRVAVVKCVAASAALEAEWAGLANIAVAFKKVIPQFEPFPITHQDLVALRSGVHLKLRDKHVVNPAKGFGAVRVTVRSDEDLLEDAREILEADGASYTEVDIEKLAPMLRKARNNVFSDVVRAREDDDYDLHKDLKNPPKRTTPNLDILWAFEEYAVKGGIKNGALGRTAKRWRPKIKSFAKWLGHRDLTKMTPANAYGWVDYLVEKGYARKSVKDVWIASLSATAGFMVERGHLQLNPFYRIKVRDETVAAVIDAAGPPRKKGFTHDEAIAILTMTLSTSSPLTTIETKAARRWLPWLCAYSGARVNEVTSLYPRDIAPDAVTGIMCMNIKPSLEKTAIWRQVPLHSHIIEQGFLRYVDSRRGSGKPLFYDPARGHGGTPGNPQFMKVAERLAEWLHKEKLIPAGILPNHGWRHLFKSTARKLKMNVEVEGFITGHRPKDSGSGYDYGDRWAETLSEEIERYPRFEVSSINLPPAPHRRVRRTAEQIAIDNLAKEKRKAARATRAA